MPALVFGAENSVGYRATQNSHRYHLRWFLPTRICRPVGEETAILIIVCDCLWICCCRGGSRRGGRVLRCVRLQNLSRTQSCADTAASWIGRPFSFAVFGGGSIVVTRESPGNMPSCCGGLQWLGSHDSSCGHLGGKDNRQAQVGTAPSSRTFRLLQQNVLRRFKHHLRSSGVAMHVIELDHHQQLHPANSQCYCTCRTEVDLN